MKKHSIILTLLSLSWLTNSFCAMEPNQDTNLSEEEFTNEIEQRLGLIEDLKKLRDKLIEEQGNGNIDGHKLEEINADINSLKEDGRLFLLEHMGKFGYKIENGELKSSE